MSGPAKRNRPRAYTSPPRGYVTNTGWRYIYRSISVFYEEYSVLYCKQSYCTNTLRVVHYPSWPFRRQEIARSRSCTAVYRVLELTKIFINSAKTFYVPTGSQRIYMRHRQLNDTPYFPVFGTWGRELHPSALDLAPRDHVTTSTLYMCWSGEGGGGVVTKVSSTSNLKTMKN